MLSSRILMHSMAVVQYQNVWSVFYTCSLPLYIYVTCYCLYRAKLELVNANYLT